MTLFQSRNYKLCVSLGVRSAVLAPVRAVFDTGAGPNLVRDDLLPRGWESLLVPDQPLPRITNASGKRMPVKGVIVLYIQVGGLRTRVRFYVVPGLGVPCILGCNFIDIHVRSIHPKERRVELREGGPIAISTDARLSGTSSAVSREPTPSRKIRIARRTVVPPRTEAHIEVTSACHGLFMVVHNAKPSAPRVTLARGIAEIRAQVPFRVRIINPTTRVQVLPKGMVIGLADPHPSRVFTVDQDDRANVVGTIRGVAEEPIDIMPKFRESHSGVTACTGRSKEPKTQDVEKIPENGQTSNWKDEVDLAHLSADERDAVLRMLKPHRGMWDGRLGTVAATSHRIAVMPGSKPVHCQPYRAGSRARVAEKQEIDRMVLQNVIEPATCEWASPIVLVPKPDGSLRFCVDYRKLNLITIPDTYPLPRMDECIDSLGDAVIFTTLDCNSGYWQIPVHPDDRDKTTFTSHYGIYRFLRLPFGLRNAPATFQRAIDIILSGVKWKTCLVYLDDVIVFSKSRQDHLSHVAEALTLLGNAGLSLKLKKCHFFAETVDYLGHVIRPGRLGVAEKNTNALKAAPLPRTQTELRSFLGLCNVYRRFVPRFSAIAAPLNALLAKGTPPQLGPLPSAAITAFNLLRERLLSPPVLALPRAEGALWLDTDASDGQLGCCLIQNQPDGKSLPLGYWSRTLNAAERNYSTTEKECLAIVWAVTHLRPYLEGTEFTVRTDHHALRWVMNLSDAQGRLARWRLRLAEFTFKVEYHPGIAHHAADAMSRIPHQAVPSEPIEEDIPVCAVNNPLPVLERFPTALQEGSPDPIQEIPLVHVETLFEYQCRDPLARHRSEARLSDLTWDYDCHGILGHRKSSGEVEVYVPPALRNEGPCAIIYPVAGDGSDLTVGVIKGKSARKFTRKSTDSLPGTPETGNTLRNPPVSGRTTRLLTRARYSPEGLHRSSHVGLAVALTTDNRNVIPTGKEQNVTTISSDELRTAQAADITCQKLLTQTSTTSLYDLNDDGILVRVSPSDGSQQVVIPKDLVSRILYMEHYPPSAGHPGAHRMFQTIRRTFFWPRIAEDVYETVRMCDVCARNRIAEKRKTNPLKLFPAKGPLESVAMDILGPLPRTKHGNRFLLVIADRYSKVTKTVPLRTVTALSVSRAFCDHWAYVYGPPVSLLTDNGPQFTAKFFQAVCAELGIQKVFTTAYHPQTNGQVERYNRTILASLRGYVAARQDDWDDFTSAVTFAYNCRVHSSLGMPPFELALSRPPRTLSLEASPRAQELTPEAEKKDFLERLKTLRLSANQSLHKAQARYKRNYDRGVRPKNVNLKEGDQAYLRVEVTDIGRNHKLESLVQGPYEVLENAGETFRLRIGGETVRVSSDRVTRAPVREESVHHEDHPNPIPSQVAPTPVPSATEDSPPVVPIPVPRPTRPPRRVRFTLPEPDPPSEYVVDKLVDAAMDEGGHILYRTRWMGYTELDDTWQEEESLPTHFIRRYWRTKGLTTSQGENTLH